MRPGASTCAAHRPALSAPSALATEAGSPGRAALTVCMGTSAMRVSAHLLTAARKAANDGKDTDVITVVGWVPDGVAGGTGSSIQRGMKGDGDEGGGDGDDDDGWR